MDYAEKFRMRPDFQYAVANWPGPDWWYSDPLVLFLRLHSGLLEGADANGDHPTPTGVIVDNVMKAIRALDGFHGGQWERVSTSLVAAAHLLWAEYGWDYGWTTTTLNLTGASIYDAATLLERQIAGADDAATAHRAPPASASLARRVKFRPSGAVSDAVSALASWTPGDPWPL